MDSFFTFIYEKISYVLGKRKEYDCEAPQYLTVFPLKEIIIHKIDQCTTICINLYDTMLQKRRSRLHLE